MTYEATPGTHVNKAVEQALAAAKSAGQDLTMPFNDKQITVYHDRALAENILIARTTLGLPEVDPPFHPQTAADALARWDAGKSVFTIEMGGLGPGYEQAIQVLVFEIIRDWVGKPMPNQSDPEFKKFSDSFADASVHRIDKQMGGYSGAQVGAAKQVAYRALRDGWEKMLKSVPDDRKIQVSKHVPNL